MNREGLLRAAEERSQELVRQAAGQSQILLQRAGEHTEQLKAEADAYAAETLHNLREHLTSIETEISRTILSIEKGLESLDQPEYQHMSESEEEEPRVVEEFQAPAHRVPRRASLATDTMGLAPDSTSGPGYQ
jgi:cell division septum initiation protein DivIVA